MAARDDFLHGLAALKRLVRDPKTLGVLQHSLGDPQRDEQARLLRNGLAVSSFALLEGFIKSRASEVLAIVSASPLAFSQLPDRLQELTTREVVDALRFQVGLLKRRNEDPTPLIQSTGQELSSTATQTYQLSSLAFGQSRSNLGQQDIKDLLGAFKVQDGWGITTRIAQRMGLAPLSLQEDFAQSAQRRHLAAHIAQRDTPLGDLQSFPQQALGIAAAFDAVLSRAAYELLSGNHAYAKGSAPFDAQAIRLRFFEQDGTTFRDVNESATRAAARGSDPGPVFDACRRRALQVGAVVVFRGRGIPLAWECTDLAPGRP